jgi:hypothetical protein
MHGVFTIRNYISQTDDKQINLTTLLVHFIAFILYLLSLAAVFASSVPYDVNSENEKGAKRFCFALCFIIQLRLFLSSAYA